MKFKVLAILTLACLALGAFSYDASASDHRNPASCLLYPYYNTGNYSLSVMTVTNTCAEDVWLHLVWIPEYDCSPNNLWIELTGYDTFTFLDAALGFQLNTRGFLYLYAVDGDHSNTKIDFDHLIGQELIIVNSPDTPGSVNLITFSVNAVPFQALAVNNSHNFLRLDGTEYDLAPSCLFFPRFFGQPNFPGQPGYFWSEVILINLTGGKWFTVTADMLIYNDDEQAYSEFAYWDCWQIRPLNHLTEYTNATWNSFLLSTSHDKKEPYGFADKVETGWIKIWGSEAYNPVFPDPQAYTDAPSIYAVLIETLGFETFAGADLPWQLEDNNYDHATLWSTSLFGDL